MRALGVVLTTLAASAFIYQGIAFTRPKQVREAGSAQAATTEKNTVPMMPLLVSAALIGGVVLIAAGKKSPHP